MSWNIQCMNNCTDYGYTASNIVDLLDNYRDEGTGWFLCNCGNPGYVQKEYELQERDQRWEPILKGAIRLGVEGDTYQPFVFLVVYDQDNVLGDTIEDIWFSYYKDTRPDGGRLKLGYGPGGPPVLGQESIRDLISRLVDIGYLDCADLGCD